MIVSLVKSPLYGFYYILPFLPYRTLRNHILVYPLGAQMLTILVLSIIAGALLHGKRLPKSKLYLIWLIFALYLYVSMWLGVVMRGAPLPLFLGDANFVTWKDYILIPLVFVAGGLVLEDRRSIRTTVLITALALLAVDRSCILESLSRSWGSFDENKRDPGPLAYGANQTAAFLAQFAMFFWGFTRFVKRLKWKIVGYGLVSSTLFAAMYTFSRGGYLAILFAVLVLGIVNDRKWLILLGIFLFTWQAVVPVAVRERVQMTKNDDGHLEASAQERVDLWENAEKAIIASPIFGQGFATFQFGEHVDNLKDTHNWYVKVMVETGAIGLALAFWLIQQMVATSYKLLKRSSDPLYAGLGLGLLLATSACIIANIFGDRWTYLEITGLLWALYAAGVRALELASVDSSTEMANTKSLVVRNPYLRS